MHSTQYGLRPTLLVWLALLGLVTTGCMQQASELVLKPDELLPPGYSERKVPDAFMETLGLRFTSTNQGWARGFICDGDWDATAKHIEDVVTGHGYHAAKKPLVRSNDASTAGLEDADYLRDFVS